MTDTKNYMNISMYSLTYLCVFIYDIILCFRYKLIFLFSSPTISLTFPFSLFLSSGKVYGRALSFPKAQTHESIMLGIVDALH